MLCKRNKNLQIQVSAKNRRFGHIQLLANKVPDLKYDHWTILTNFPAGFPLLLRHIFLAN